MVATRHAAHPRRQFGPLLRQSTYRPPRPVHATCPLGFGRSNPSEAEPQQPGKLVAEQPGASPALTGGYLARVPQESSLRALELLQAQQVNRYAGVPKPQLLAIGLTVHSAPVALREQLSIPEAEWPRAIAELTQYPHIEEAAVLSTCNRLELYAVLLSWHPGVREVEDWLCRTSGLPLEQLRPHLFLLREQDAAHHLLRVASGLDSLVLGEGQILAQVKQVHKVGQSSPGFGRQLNGLFKQALVAGKRVRSETAISAGSVSISSAAAELAALKLSGAASAAPPATARTPATSPSGSLSSPSSEAAEGASASSPPSASSSALAEARVCIIGAGRMAALLVRHLAAKGCGRITLVNRSLPRAEALAAQFPDVAFELRLMTDLLPSVEEADVVFAASGSEELLLNRVQVEVMPCRPAAEAGRGVRRFIDISVPRNIAPDIAAIAGNEVYNVDDLREVVEANVGARASAAAQAEALVVDEVRAFGAWRESLGTVPTIKALRTKAEAIRACEFSKATGKLGQGLSKKQLAVVEELSRGIVNKLLHGPMNALRCDGADPAALDRTLHSMSVVESMFNLAEVEMEAPVGGQ